MYSFALSSRRFKAAGFHLLISALVAAAAAVLVFGLWYPAPFGTLAGGTALFSLLVAIDVVSGPALTAVVASPGKPRGELVRDMTVIAAVQCAALGYGIYTMAAARPVAVVFEIDLMRVVAAVDVDVTTLNQAPPTLQKLSWTGPWMMAAARPTDAAEQLRTIELGLDQVHLAMLPRYWREYGSLSDAAWARARPVRQLLNRYPTSAAELARIASEAHAPEHALRFLPLVSRQASWTAVLAPPHGRVVGHLPLDAFF